MNIRFGVTIKLVALAAMISISMIIYACTKPNDDSATKAESVAIGAARPVKIAKAYVYDGGICTIDSSHGQAVSNLIASSKKLPFEINGWAVTESTGKPVSPMIFSVLSGDHGTFYFEGKRERRPDIAKGNHLLDLAGFDVVGSLSNIPVGEYKLSIAMGTEFVVAVCKTKVVVSISE